MRYLPMPLPTAPAGTTRAACAHRATRLCRALCVAAICATAAHSALAVLGQALPPGASTVPGSPTRSAGVSAKAAAAPGSTSALAASSYSISKTVQSSGTTVTEYATPAGVVFALAWEGPSMPDLGSLLGSYFGTFKAQADASRAARNIGTPVGIDAGTVVVRSSGRMRNYSGNAYAPGLVPAGVTISDVLP